MALPIGDSLDGVWIGRRTPPRTTRRYEPQCRVVQATYEAGAMAAGGEVALVGPNADGLRHARGGRCAQFASSPAAACSAEARSIDLLRRFFYLEDGPGDGPQTPGPMPVWDYISELRKLPCVPSQPPIACS